METETVTEAEAAKFENEPSLPTDPLLRSRPTRMRRLSARPSAIRFSARWCRPKAKSRDWSPIRSTSRTSARGSTISSGDRAPAVRSGDARLYHRRKHGAAARHLSPARRRDARGKIAPGGERRAAQGASPIAGALWALVVVVALAVLGLALRAGYLDLTEVVSARASACAPRASARCRASARGARGRRSSRRTA